MKTAEIRKKFLDFFASKGHAILPSDSLVPKDDPTVLFTTAGMQQFKKQFLGQADGPRRVATSQKCLRTDDLKEVGQTAFHHTFFEMLGNFSFADYFKKDAIAWAWEFLTKVLRLNAESLWVSVYQDDQEAEAIWLENIKINPKKLIRLGDKSNFWPSETKSKGPNGPCGPCSEIFYDYGQHVGCQEPTCTPACDCGRFSEIWNLVFTQFNRKEDTTLEPLPGKNIDTGMGLERLAAVIQQKATNFEIDLFEPIFQKINACARDAKITLTQREKNIIADHMRAIVIGIADGVIPSNEGRGYVIKKLITDATDILLEKSKSSFIHLLVGAVVEAMKDPYQDLVNKEKTIMAWVEKTESAYKKVRTERLPELIKEIKSCKDGRGEILFKYHDTYGLTLAATRIAMQNAGLTSDEIRSALDQAEHLMDAQRERSRAASKMTGDVFINDSLNVGIAKTQFVGEESLKTQATVLRIFLENNQEIDEAAQGQAIKIILDKTPFYAESGGQQGDAGTLEASGGLINITQTYKASDVFIHEGQILKGSVKKNDSVTACVDPERRMTVMRNHTATHLLQAALRKILGAHVQQQGSLVAENYLRFDFAHPKALTPDELIHVEDTVNQNIRRCIPVSKEEMPMDRAQQQGALAFFAEKYNQTVRVVAAGDFSKELCGGTHVTNTGEIGIFKITHESAIAQGIRRIEAVTGDFALRYIHESEKILLGVSQALKASAIEVLPRLSAQQARIKHLEKTVSQLRLNQILASLGNITQKMKSICGLPVIIESFEDVDIDTLKQISDAIKQKAQSVIVVLGSQSQESTALIIAVTEDLIKKGIRANDLIVDIAGLINAKGGGRPSLAQAGSKNALDLKKALTGAEDILKRILPQ